MKVLKFFMVFTLLFCSSCFYCSTMISAQFDFAEMSSIIGNDRCTLLVKNSSGNPVKSVKVSTDVSGGISCVGGRSFYTDSDGKVSLEWSSGCYLKKIFVDGKSHDVNFKNGNSYTITM